MKFSLSLAFTKYLNCWVKVTLGNFNYEHLYLLLIMIIIIKKESVLALKEDNYLNIWKTVNLLYAFTVYCIFAETNSFSFVMNYFNKFSLNTCVNDIILNINVFILGKFSI